MRLTLVCVGRLKETYFTAAADEYLKRIRRVLPCEVVEVKAEADLLRRCPPRAERWVLDERGRELGSLELARELGRRMTSGSAGVAFLLGGAEGHSETVRRGADVVLSLSRFTLAHRIARLVLLEQLYRALTIVRGEPYHK